MRETMMTAGGHAGASSLSAKRLYLLGQRERVLVELPELLRREGAWHSIRDPIWKRREEVTVPEDMDRNKQNYLVLARAIERFNRDCRAAGRDDLTIGPVTVERR
jgi:hypothetical protein